MEYLIGFAIIVGIAFAVISGLTSEVKNSIHNIQLRRELEKKMSKMENYFIKRDKVFQANFSKGRQWLADFIAEAEDVFDKAKEEYLLHKSYPAPNAAEVVKQIRGEKREIKSKLKFIEYQLKSYEEYFPFLDEYKDIILEERVDLRKGQDNIEEIETSDPVHLYLDKQEYQKLSSRERNQLALDRYLSRSKTNWEIGRLYERYLGYFYEKRGWRVRFHGAIMGFEDFGRDLICTRNRQVHIVQAKCWSKEKLIREKHIFQLFGSTIHYRKEYSEYEAHSVFITTT